MKINLRTILTITAIISLTYIAVAQTLTTSLTGNAHWINDTGVIKYVSEADFVLTINGETVTLQGPVYVRSRE